MTIHLRQTAATAAVALLSLSLGACARAGAQAPCSGPPCRVYLPLVGAGMQLAQDGGEAGPARWQPLGPHDRVLDLAYGPDGTLWAATEGGLVSWPGGGGRPRVHTHEPVSLVAVDGEGGVWFGGQVAPYEAATRDPMPPDTLTRLVPDGTLRSFGEADGLPPGRLMDLATDDRGRLYAAWSKLLVPGDSPEGRWAAGGLARWDAADSWRVWPGASLGPGGPSALSADGQGGIWLAGADRVFPDGEPSRWVPWLRRVDAQGELLAGVQLPPEARSIYRMALGGEGTLHAITGDRSCQTNGLVRRSPDGSWSTVDLPRARVELMMIDGPLSGGPCALAVDGSAVLWLAFQGTLVGMNPKGDLQVFPRRLQSSGSTAVGRDLGSLLGVNVALAARSAGGVVIGGGRHPGVGLAGVATREGWDRLALPPSVPGRVNGLSSGRGGAFVLGTDELSSSSGKLPLREEWRERELRLWSKGPEDRAWMPADGLDQQADYRRRDLTLGPLAIDRQGHYWIGDGKQLIEAAPDLRRLGVYTAESGLLPGGRIRSLTVGPDGALWVGTDKGLARRSPKAVWGRHPLPPGVSKVVRDIEPISDGSVWLALDTPPAPNEQGGVLHLGADGHTRFWSSTEIVNAPEVAGETVGMSAIALSPGGKVYAANGDGLFSSEGGKAWTRLDFEPHDLASRQFGVPLTFDATGMLWTFDRRKGLVQIDPRDDSLLAVELPELESEGGQDETPIVADIALDLVTGDLWFAGRPSRRPTGLLLRRDRGGRFELIDLESIPGTDLFDSLLGRIALAPNGTVAATSAADRMLLRGPTLSGVWEPQQRTSSWGRLGHSSCVEPDGRIWFDYRSGLSVFDPAQGWQHLQTAHGLPDYWLRDLRVACAPDGAPWLLAGNAEDGSEARVGRLELRTLALEAKDQAFGLGPWERVSQLVWSERGRMAAVVGQVDQRTGAFSTGPWLLVERSDGSFERHEPGVLSTLKVDDLLWTADERLWIASSQGLASLDPEQSAAQPRWSQDPAVAGRALMDLHLHEGSLWALGSGGAAELTADGVWRRHTVGVGASAENLVQAGTGPSGELWLLDSSGTVHQRLR